MGRRRSNNEGTIFFEERDDLWVAEISLPDGKRKRKRNKSQKVVREWLLEQRKLIKEGLWVKDDSYTVGAFIDRWYKDVAMHTLRPKTLELYEILFRLHIKPDLGETKLNDLRADQLQWLYSKKLESGLSKRSVECIHSVLHKVLDTAAKWQLVTRNVADLVDPPRPEKKLVEPLTPDQVTAFLKATRDDRLFPLWVLLLGCGLRRGEALGLFVEDVSLAEKVVHVRRNLQWLNGQGPIIGKPKSEKGIRDVGIPDFAIGVLAGQIDGKSKGEYVFSTANGTPFMPRNVIKYFKEGLEKAGLPKQTRLHDLRHTYISYLLSQKVPPKDVQVLAGHSTFDVTMDTYGHLMPGATQNAADKANGIFNL